MRVLHELIHSLAKEEKRLYQLHKRENSFQRIYEGYVKAPQFTKALDEAIYTECFATVSRAFYSMQKRSLMDDMLGVLQEHSNHQHPAYQYLRLYSRARLLLERKLGDAAAGYAAEAYQVAATSDQLENGLLALRAQRQALLQDREPSLSLYEELEAKERAHLLVLEERRTITRVQETLQLLALNVDGYPPEEVLQKARQAVEELPQPDADSDSLERLLELLACWRTYAELLNDLPNFHRRLVQVYERVAPRQVGEPRLEFFQLMNLVRQSALQSGDFLQLTGLNYKLSREMPQWPTALREACGPDYLELQGLLQFYENDLSNALLSMGQLVDTEGLPRGQLLRCIYYRLAMLLAAHLAGQARDEIASYSKRLPELAEHSLTVLVEILIAMDLYEDPEEILFKIERLRIRLRKQTEGRHLMECLTQLTLFLERKKVRYKPLQVFPSAWENILRVDLWLRAKQENKFYYSLVMDDWMERRRVF